jgi:hypothetical protein
VFVVNHLKGRHSLIDQGFSALSLRFLVGWETSTSHCHRLPKKLVEILKAAILCDSLKAAGTPRVLTLPKSSQRSAMLSHLSFTLVVAADSLTASDTNAAASNGLGAEFERARRCLVR